MSSEKSLKSNIKKNSAKNFKNEINMNNQENNIKIIKRTLDNNTHISIEDTKLKNVTSWRKSETKFLQNLVFNIFSLGILHIISLFYPKLYLKLYCNPWPAKECDFFLIENIYGQYTLCSKIHKKSKHPHNITYNTEMIKDNTISSSLLNYNNKMDNYLTKNLTYSFKYKSVTYEYNEETNEIIPVYMNLTKMTNKGIFDFFSEGLSSERLVKIFKERYGKNEYYINLGITYFYFKRIELVYLIFTLVVQSINIIFEDYILFYIFCFIVLILILIEYIITRQIIYNLYKKEYTLDGEKNKIKVKRKHNLSNSSNFYFEIKNSDLLPGDIIYLKTNDLVPCDCLILEGECIVNEDVLNGSLDIYKKTALNNNNELFSYRVNKINTLYHGMKIVKTISKLNGGYISVLCINTGPNTYKANQYSNILYLFERKDEYKKAYRIFGKGRKNMIFLIFGALILTILLGFFFPLIIGVNYDFIKRDKNILINCLTRLICKSCMLVFFLTNSIIYYMGVIHLKHENIFCFEKSKVIIPSKIDTIFFGKTGILCENYYEINAFHPVYINPHRPNVITFRTYRLNQCKEMNSQLLKYYKDYLYKCQNNIFSKNFNIRNSFLKDKNKFNVNKINLESSECITLFLECLLSCNNIEKYNTEIFGNSIETEIFKNMKWDIKSFRFNNNINKKEIEYSNDYSYLNEMNNNNDNNKFQFDHNFNLVDKNINDIYPNNYYKITESYKNDNERENKPIITRFNSKYYLRQMKKKKSNPNVSEFSISPNISNCIKNNISESHIISYKLRIYKRFIKNGTFNSSAIVYNFITKELRFMTKGIPEDILDKCDKSSIPDNFDNIISIYRRKGFILIICAYKIINIDSYKDSNPIEDYMNNLNFIGFVSLKNKLKKEVINSIKDLRQFSCNLIISTGDNVFNCLPVGFDSTIIDNKNIFAFDKEDKKNRIIISKIYSIRKANEDEQEQKSNSPSLDKLSKHTLTNRITSSNLIFKKDTISGRSKKDIFKNKDDLSIKIGNEESDKKIENKILNSNKSFNESVNKKVKSSNNYEYDKNSENEKNQNNHKYYNYSNVRNFNKEKDMKISLRNHNITPLNLQDKILNRNIRSKVIEYNDNPDSSTNRKIGSKNDIKNKFEKYYFYPGIFEDYEELSNNCIYCISGKAFNFLYKNKEKKQCKKLLDKIHNNCKIFFSMSSVDKSLAIDFYREYQDSCVCTIGKYPNDFDAIMTSHVGISLNPPKNENTILCHFYSADSTILSIKKIIREGRTISENIILLKITGFFYTIILNSYILSCLYYTIDIDKRQLNFLEICFLILSISAFTAQYDNTKNSSPLIQNKKLYFYHYVIQIIGIFIFKILGIYFLYRFYRFNSVLEEQVSYRVFCTYFFILCVEQLFSIFFIFNYISFYRKHPLNNLFFVFFNLLIIFYFILLITLNSGNFKSDILEITYFEFSEDLVDAYDENNRINCFKIYILDFFCCLIYSRIVYFIFDRLSKRKS